MKTPLLYQMTEYDCGPTSVMNAVRFLFEREEIPPEIVRNIMLYSLDAYSKDGVAGESGTSRMAMMFLANWLEGCGEAKVLPVYSRYLRGEQVYVGENSEINDALRRNGVAVVRLNLDVDHYVLFTGVEGDSIKIFDPYLSDGWPDDAVTFSNDPEGKFNRIVPYDRICSEESIPYALGPKKFREAVLIFNTKTMLTSDKTIEYFI